MVFLILMSAGMQFYVWKGLFLSEKMRRFAIDIWIVESLIASNMKKLTNGLLALILLLLAGAVEAGTADDYRRLSYRYGMDAFNVYYRGVKIADASVTSFKVLSDGYALDAFNVYYRGVKIGDASVTSFKVLSDGYALDAFNVYYRGREIEDASVTSFKTLGRGYAKDTWNYYFKGRKLDDAF